MSPPRLRLFLDQGLVVVQPAEMYLDTPSGSPAADPKLTEPEVQNMLAIKENWKLAVTLTAQASKTFDVR